MEIVSERIKLEDRNKWHFYVDAVYRADPSLQGTQAEVLSKLMHVLIRDTCKLPWYNVT